MSDTHTADRWSTEQVLALAPDASAQRAARGLAGPRPWRGTGSGQAGDAAAPTVWGLCRGSSAAPYQTCVDVAEPAFRCSCPSRRIPCKHALGLLLLWSAGAVPEGTPPDWVQQWQADRAGRAERAQARRTAAGQPPDPQVAARRAASAAKTVARRAERVASGLTELDGWLADQVRRGLAEASRAGYAHWEGMAARLVDAQAPGAASAVRRLAWVAVAASPDQLLAELALLRLLVAGHDRLDQLPAGLAAAVKVRVGYPTSTEEVLATAPVRDDWLVVGVRDEADENLSTRRVWLRGAHTRRPALVLSFAAAGQSLPSDLPLGAALDADLCFYPGGLRALVAARHAPGDCSGSPPGAGHAEPERAVPVIDAGSIGSERVAGALHEYAVALAGDPWLDRWPMLLNAVTPVPAGNGWHVVDRTGDALPLASRTAAPWRLIAAAGGHAVPVAGEWSPGGLRPLTAWVEGRPVRL